MVRNTSDDTQSDEMERRSVGGRNGGAIGKERKRHDGGGGDSKGGRTAKDAKEEWQQLRQENFDVVQLEFDKTESGAETKRARTGWSLGKHGVMGVSDSSRNECGFRRPAELERILYMPTNGNSRLQEMVCTRKKQPG